jgi:hypothetical protein
MTRRIAWSSLVSELRYDTRPSPQLAAADPQSRVLITRSSHAHPRTTRPQPQFGRSDTSQARPARAAAAVPRSWQGTVRLCPSHGERPMGAGRCDDGRVGERPIRTRAERMRGYARVREARSLATTPDRLAILAMDDIRPVRVWVAGNPATPPEALTRLAADADSTVRWWALHNVNLPETALWQVARAETIAYGAKYFIDRTLVVHHPNASEALRAAFAAACRCPSWCSGRSAYPPARAWAKRYTSR